MKHTIFVLLALVTTSTLHAECLDLTGDYLCVLPGETDLEHATHYMVRQNAETFELEVAFGATATQRYGLATTCGPEGTTAIKTIMGYETTSKYHASEEGMHITIQNDLAKIERVCHRVKDPEPRPIEPLG